MSDDKGNIRARKLGNTGITEDILKRIADARGGHILAIVELKADTIHEQVDGDDRLVDFLIDTIEPVVDGNLNGRGVDLVRNIQQALYRSRKLSENAAAGDAELAFDDEADGPAPKVDQILAEGDAIVDVDEEGPKFWDPASDTEPAMT